MSLIPYILSDFVRPTHLLDQNFGLGLRNEDFWSPYAIPQDNRLHNSSQRYYRPWKASAARSDSGSLVSVDKDTFQINLDVQHFSPEEIIVKVTDDNYVIVEARHGEKEDEHGFISRHFVRKYHLPYGTNINKILSSLSSDGVLTITAPLLDESDNPERIIPIQQTGVPSKSMQNKPVIQEGNGDKK